jgi:signal transduction histidine kinase/HPt (histidine-containing phosphotransfer) domain-containing protein
VDETINITALAVNDNPDQLYLMKRLLRSVGYRVLTAGDGREAFDLLLGERVDILISDVMMPVLDGIELCRLVRADPKLRSIPILLVSALRKDAASVVEGLHAGADDYIEHPFEPLALAARVARLLERKRTEDQVRRLNEELEIRVRERTEQFERTNKELQHEIEERRFIESALEKARDAALEATRLKSEFLANVSHEIRTPMHALTGMAELLLKSQLQPRQREYVESIMEGAQSLLNIINDVLDLSKIEAGELRIARMDFELADVVSNSVQMFAQRAWAKGLELTSSVEERIPPVLQGDPGRLWQIITNLLSNAVKFTEAGSITLAVSLADEAESDVTLRFEVSDTGIGVSPDATRLIFLPFAQADGSYARVYGGTGLGLAISRQFVELMGGEIGVETEVGRGSTFWFTVKLGKPAHPAEETPLGALREGRREAAPSAHAAAEPPRAKGVTVLVAEDNAMNRTLIRYMLEELGFTATVVSEGASAVAEHARGGFRLVLMDCQLPVMDGFAAVAEIRRREGDERHTPIIALTADAMNGMRERCLAAGMDDYLSKPFTTEQLGAVIDKWINGAPAPDALAPPGDDAGADAPTLDFRLLDQFGGPAAGGRGGRAAELVETFLADVRERRRSLGEAYEQRDLERLKREAHTFTGGAGLFGAARLSNICDRLIDLAARGDAPALLQAFDEMDAELEQVTSKLEQWTLTA